MGGDGIGGGDGMLKAKLSGVIGESVENGDELSLEAIEEEEDVFLVDGVLNGALDAFGDMRLCFGDVVLASSCECYFEKCLPLVSLRHHQVDEKKIRDERRRRRKWNDADIFTSFAFLDDSKRKHDLIDNVILTIIEIGVPFNDLSKQASQKHTVRTQVDASLTCSPLMTRLDSATKASRDHSVVKTD
nr:hypothetical protein [Tanacetum cinerariifolium]